MRESESVDFERNPPTPGSTASPLLKAGGSGLATPKGDIIQGHAGSPSVFLGDTTPGMLTPKELVSTGNTPMTEYIGEEDESGAAGGGGEGGSTGGGGTNIYEKEHNPFGQFSSVTRDVGGW
jgi:protein-serine/threonine kinase